MDDIWIPCVSDNIAVTLYGTRSADREKKKITTITKSSSFVNVVHPVKSAVIIVLYAHPKSAYN